MEVTNARDEDKQLPAAHTAHRVDTAAGGSDRARARARVWLPVAGCGRVRSLTFSPCGRSLLSTASDMREVRRGEVRRDAGRTNGDGIRPGRRAEILISGGGGRGYERDCKRLSKAVRATTWRAHVHVGGWRTEPNEERRIPLWCRQLLPHQPSIPPARFTKRPCYQGRLPPS